MSERSWIGAALAQFGRRRLAVWSARGVLGLVMVAIYAPVFLSNKPFVWDEGKGLSSPWLASLFDRNFFENTIDIGFNSLLVVGTPLALGVAALWRRVAKGRLLVGAFAVWALALALILAFPSQSPKVVYPERQAQLGAQVSLAVYPPLPYSYRDGTLADVNQAPSVKHWLGTDAAGCDVFTRMVYGTRVSLTVGILAVLLYVSFGTLYGGVAGFFGGRVDAVLMRLVEVVICVPSLFLILAVAAFLPSRSIFQIMFLIAAVAWTGPARLVRAEVLRLRELEFVMAARAAGFGPWRILVEEILPNALGPVLVSATFGVASSILIESTMSFLGLGDLSLPSWGQVLSAGRQTGAWPLILAPGFAIFVTVSMLNLLGEGVRDALDPRLRGA